MSENHSRGLRDFTEYDSMTTEALEEILRSDAGIPVGQDSDEELLFYVMGVLADRRNNTEVTGKTALEAYESFKQHYLPEEEKIDSAPAVKAQKRRRPICWLRSLAAAAAVLVIVMFGSMTANAMGFNVWETVVTWAQETFHFGSSEKTETDEPNSSENAPYQTLQEALLQNNEDTSVAPVQIPDGYSLIEIIIDETPLQKVYFAIYQNGNNKLKITVRSHLDNYPEQIEQGEGFVEAYGSSDVTYYLFSNYEQTQAAWVNGFYECYISGELTLNQLKLMIDSIGKG